MIHFVGKVQSNFGRGKDKAKRKTRVSPLVGAGLGTVAGGPVGSIAGALIAKGVNKERDRFDKEGARSHLGKVGHDARLGAKSLGIGSAITAGLTGAALGSSLPTHRKKGFLGLGRDKKAEARDKLKNTLMGAGLGVLGGGVSGVINGAGTGALVGAGRGFVQENKAKKKKKENFNQYIDDTKFANFEAPYYSTSKYNPSTSPPKAKVKIPKSGVNLGAAKKFIGKNKIGLGLGAGTLAAGLITNQIRKSKAKKQSPFNQFIK
jgi:hypothetical protein